MLNGVMINFNKLIAILLLLLVFINISHAASYSIVSSQTYIRFALDNFKTAATTGGFYNVKGQLQYNSNLKTGNISLDIPINSLDTGSTAFNTKLTGADFFDAQQFPLARFESTKWYFDNTAQAQLIKVDGNLTLHGETHPISLKTTKFECSVSSILKTDSCSGKFIATIDRTKWSINKYTLFGITKELTLNIQVKAVKQ